MNQTAAMEREGKGREETAATGPFEFFRKYQKLILYTAGLFALVSFSITGALMGFFDRLFRDAPSLGTIEVGGRVVQVTEDDYAVARVLRQPFYRGGAGYPAVVLPPLGGDQDDNLVEVYAMLRRAAIENGIEVSSVEVERAIDHVVQQSLAQGGGMTATQIALQYGHASLQSFRNTVTEAMRIGLYLRLESLAADTSDAAMAEAMLEAREKISLKVAELDRAALQEELAAEDVPDETLETWLAELDDLESAPFRDTNWVSLLVAGVVYDEFERELFTEELTDLIAPGEQQLRQVYERDKETRFRKQEEPKKEEDDEDKGPPEQDPPAQDPPDPEQQQDAQADQDQAADRYFPFEEVKPRIQRMLEAEEVLREFWSEVQVARSEHLMGAQTARDEKLREKDTALVNRDAAREASEADPDNEELQADLAKAEEDLAAAETALEEAETALDRARTEFDMRAAFDKVRNGRPGFHVVAAPQTEDESPPEPTNADGLRELPTFGTWTGTLAATSVGTEGELSTMIQRADHGAFHFMVTGFRERPLKPLEEIRDEVRTAYFRAKADELAAEKGEAFEAALLRLAKEEISERVAELEAEKETELEARLQTWRQETGAARDEAKRRRDEITDQRLTAYQRRKAAYEALVAELEDEDSKRAELKEAVDQEIEEKINAEAREVYGEVLEAAAAEAGFTVETLPPYSRQLAGDDPRFEYRYPDNVKFLFRDPTVQALEEGETTELLDDATGRALRMAVCAGVEAVSLEDLTRRQVVQRRMGFPQQRIQNAYAQSFTMEALRERLKWNPSADLEEEATAGPGK